RPEPSRRVRRLAAPHNDDRPARHPDLQPRRQLDRRHVAHIRLPRDPMSYAARLPRTPVLMLASAIAAAAAVLAVISVVGLLGSAGGSAGAIRTFTAPGHAFRVALPDGW